MTDSQDTLDQTLAAIRSCGGDPLDLPFWEGCRQGRLLLHRCGVCGRHYWPASRCLEHGAQAMAWVQSEARGTLYTFTVMHHAYMPAMRDKVPYVVGVVKLLEGPFFHSNVIDCSPDEVVVGMELRAVMQPHGSGLVVPMFRPA